MTSPPPIPLPTDASAIEFDAPPPAGARSLSGTRIAQIPSRPSSPIVDIPNERTTITVFPEYDAPAPATRAR